MGPFTRNEVLILAFMACFAAAGAVLGRLRGPVDAPVTVRASAFPVHHAPAAAPVLVSGTGTISVQVEKKLENGEVKININRAGVENLARLKGIGPALASRIIAYRNTHGAFKSVSELQNVKGIGPKKMVAILPLIEL
ncbi:MAG: helix-hairpin-helix domain-containing protein [Fibrobacterota bacterium]